MMTEHHWPVYGHDWAVNHLRKSILHGRMRHAYLLVGTPQIGKKNLALAFAMALNCTHDDLNARPCGECRACKRIASGNHIDLRYAENDANGVIKIEEIRNITSWIAMQPYEARYRVALLPNFDQTQPRAQDALLKTLEEPPPHAVLILLASSAESILSTITSRSQILYLRPVPAAQIQAVLLERYHIDEEQAALLARLSSGRIEWAIEAAQNPELLTQREEALDLLEDTVRKNRAGQFDLAAGLGRDKPALATLLDLWQTYWRDVLLRAEESGVKLVNVDRTTEIDQLLYDISAEDALKALQATRKLRENLTYNLNIRLALESMFLDYPHLG